MLPVWFQYTGYRGVWLRKSNRSQACRLRFLGRSGCSCKHFGIFGAIFVIQRDEILRTYVLSTQVSAPPLCALEPRGLLPAEPIVDVLKYSQKDLDAVVRPGSCFVTLPIGISCILFSISDISEQHLDSPRALIWACGTCFYTDN